jgi:hypothetical protein
MSMVIEKAGFVPRGSARQLCRRQGADAPEI